MPQSILLVDDDPQLAQMLAQVAHARGLNVIADVDALAVGGGHRIAAAILRVASAAAPEFATLDRLRASGATAEVIVVVDRDAIESIAARVGDVFAYLPSPVEPQQLFATLDRALERHRLTWELGVLNEVAAVVSSALDVRTVLQRAAERVADAFLGSRVIVRLRETGETAPVVASVGLDEAMAERLYRAGAGKWPSDVVMDTGVAMRVDDMAAYRMPRPDEGQAFPAQSVVAAPIVAGGHVIGAVTVVSDQTGRFTRSDERLLLAIGGQFGVAVSNGRMYEAARRAHALEQAHARDLRVVSEDLRLTNVELIAALERLRTTQAQLVQAEKLTALGQLVAGVAHELNNPLTSIMGYAQLVQQQLRLHPEVAAQLPRFNDDVLRIVTEADRAARIIRSLLTFARRQSSRRVREDVGDLCRRAADLRAYDLRLKDIEVTTSFAPGLPPVLVDGGQIQQALLNLMLNAEQAMQGSATRRLHIGVAEEARCCAVVISVKDTGHGIDATNLKRVFDPFFTTRAVGEGTGLGLSIVHGIVRGHGGDVWVTSRPGVETTFFVRLPADSVTQPSAVSPKVLIAHADLDVRGYLSAMCQGWGYDVIQAHRLHDALEALAEGFAGVVLLDESMVDDNAQDWEATWKRTSGAVLIALGAPGAGGTAAESLRRSARASVAGLFDVCHLRHALLEAGVAPPAVT